MNVSSELVQIRKQGYAISIGERDEGVGAIAAPVFDSEGHIQCSLSESAPSRPLQPGFFR